MTTTAREDTGPPGTDDDLGDDTDAPDRAGPGTAFWIVLAVAALVLGGAIGWRVGKAGDETTQPSRDSVDVGLFQDMTTHHNQALTMGFDYLQDGTDPLLRQIAREIVTYQASEIGVMGDHLTQWGQSGTETGTAMGWMGMATPRDEMTGLATREQMDELATARGAELDQLFTRLMIVHHAGGIHMADFAAKEATTTTVRRWAASMADGQRGEIAELNRWRVQHGFSPVKI